MTRMIHTGSRAEVHATGMMLARDFAGEFRALVRPEDIKRFYERLMEGVAARDRTCMRTFAEAVKLVSSQEDMVAAFLLSVGLQGRAQAVSLVGRMSEAEGLDEDALAARSERFLREYHARHGRKLVILDESKEVNANGTAGPVEP